MENGWEVGAVEMWGGGAGGRDVTAGRPVGMPGRVIVSRRKREKTAKGFDEWKISGQAG